MQEQRRNFRLMRQFKKPRKKLTEEQITALNDLEFHWGYVPSLSTETDESWEKHFEELEKFQNTHGNFSVPAVDETKKLSQWTRFQRHLHYLDKCKHKSFLAKERFDLLNGIGFDWSGDRHSNF